MTGGAGFIGSNLCFELESQGMDVIAVDNFHSSKMDNLRGFKGRCLTQDVASEFEVKDKLDVIFHQAAITDPRYHNDQEVFEKNVEGFERMLKLSEKHQAKLVYASTAGLYGNGPIPMKEDQPKEILSPYGKSKLVADEMAEKLFARRHIVGLRYFNVFGLREATKGRPASMIYHLACQMKAGKAPRIFKWGEQVRDFVYVKDVVAANLCAMNGKSGIYNVGTGVGTTFNELIKVLNEVLKTSFEPEFFDMPYDPKTYQNNTVADVEHAKKGIGFTAAWDFKNAVADYLSLLQP